MITASDFRNGVTIEKDGNVYEIIEFQHVKPGKGAAFVRTKLKDIINGGVTETTFRPTEKFPQVRIDRKDFQYLYKDGDMWTFMDTESYEQISLGADVCGSDMKFVKENDMIKVDSYNGNVFAIEPPMFVEPVSYTHLTLPRLQYRCSATSAIRSRLTPEAASISPEHNA